MCIQCSIFNSFVDIRDPVKGRAEPDCYHSSSDHFNMSTTVEDAQKWANDGTGALSISLGKSDLPRATAGQDGLGLMAL